MIAKDDNGSGDNIITSDSSFSSLASNETVALGEDPYVPNNLYLKIKKPKETLSHQSWMNMNILVDAIASKISLLLEKGGKATLSPVTISPYVGSKTILQIGKTWITSRMKRHLYAAR